MEKFKFRISSKNDLFNELKAHNIKANFKNKEDWLVSFKPIKKQNIKAVEIFSELWSVEPKDLLVSFDGSSFHLPPETTNRGWNRNNTWYHTDQSFTRNDLFFNSRKFVC